MRTTVTLDDDVYQAARHLARTSGERLGKVLSGLVRRALTAPTAASDRGRFPVFEVPSGTAIIPASRIQKVLDEDGIV